ncbi:MBOAT family O-acyltransferase [Microbaculum marinum]|uniref:Probable alginate O-acetylase AlgI n=1 Tax=Microbaculum marinum TaxID=1764581 RepID=A0AAW9RTT0_9HYPH
MLFNSLTFILFLAIVVVVYWLLPIRARLYIILASSLLFYGFWRFDFIPLLLFSAMADYLLALALDRRSGSSRRALLVVSICINLGVLAVFKYLLFFADSAGSIASLIGYEFSSLDLNIILPLGISFYIFQTMSYTIDVYRGSYPVERDLLRYLCFVTFFPQLVAGPILRAGDLIPQFSEPRRCNLQFLSDGIRRILMGLFLKVVLADQIAGIVDTGYSRDPGGLTGFDVWTLAFLFGFQIYFDFAGYSHIAIGAASLLGIRLPENFNYPYTATSPREFWQRWHISLSTWIRDYVYLPILRGSRTSSAGGWDVAENQNGTGRSARTFSLYGTWALMGLWHGAAWTFVVWGLYHAVLVHAYRLISAVLPNSSARLVGVLGWAVTTALVMAAWIPFRAQGGAHAMAMWVKLVDPRAYGGLTLAPDSYLVAALMLGAVLLARPIRYGLVTRLGHHPVVATVVYTGFYTVVIAGCLLFLRQTHQFVYFQF